MNHHQIGLMRIVCVIFMFDHTHITFLSLMHVTDSDSPTLNKTTTHTQHADTIKEELKTGSDAFVEAWQKSNDVINDDNMHINAKCVYQRQNRLMMYTGLFCELANTMIKSFEENENDLYTMTGNDLKLSYSAIKAGAVLVDLYANQIDYMSKLYDKLVESDRILYYKGPFDIDASIDELRPGTMGDSFTCKKDDGYNGDSRTLKVDERKRRVIQKLLLETGTTVIYQIYVETCRTVSDSIVTCRIRFNTTHTT